MIPTRQILISLCSAALFCADGLHNATALTTNLVPVADTALRSTVPDNNFGSDLWLPVGVANFGSPRNHILIKFSLADIPPTAVITSATLQLILVADPTPPAGFELDRLLVDWGEGDKISTAAHNGVPATAGQATWNSRLHLSATWGSGGGQAGTDYLSSPSATNILSGITNTFSSAGLVADVQMWLGNPGTNFGWMLLATGEPTGTGKLVGSRENPDGNTPVLIIDYSVPAPPAPPTIFGTTLSGNQIRFSFNAQSNLTYAVETRDSLAIGSWTVLTNIPAQPADAIIQITNTVSTAERYFRARTP